MIEAIEWLAPAMRFVSMRRLAVGIAIALACYGRVPGRVEVFNEAPRDADVAALPVTNTDFYRRVLYTWTSPAQIAALRSSHVLLTATAATGGFVSPFLRELAILSTAAGPGREVARLLLTNPAFERRRYAWPAPFATVLGLGARTYGTALIRIELRDEAWIGRFEPTAADPFRFVDAAGSVVATADVLAHPERIGAIFHVRRERRAVIREYVVCNAAMVASWSVGTQAIRAELDAELATLAALARVPQSPPTLLAAWHAMLAFDTARYQPTPSALATIAAALDAYDPAGPALSYP